MSLAKVVVSEFGGDPRTVELSSGVTTIGRAADNLIPLVSDSNVSRYHAEIERRGNDFYLIDLNSRNGTSLNDEPIYGEKRLKNGDIINIGGETVVEFQLENKAVKKPAAETPNAADFEAPNVNVPISADLPGMGAPAVSTPTPAAPSPSSVPVILTVVAVLSGFAIVAVVAAILISTTISSSCTGEVAILSPESGVTATEATEIQVSAKNAQCIERVEYQLDGETVAAVSTPPFGTTLEPENLEQFSDENSHVLTAVVFDKKGQGVIQNDKILIAFSEKGGKEIVKDPQNGSDDPPTDPTPPKKDDGKEISLADTKDLSEKLVKQFSGSQAYKFDRQFLSQVQARTKDYRAEGYYNRALAYRDAINVAFVGEQGLDAPVGYLLAMSRSRFELKKNGADEGLWQMSTDFVTNNGYNGQCGTETLSDSKQNCAARAAAAYTKALVVNLFEGDVLYGVSCFGMSPADCGNFKISLPADRSDFWNAIKSPKQRDTLVRFFAAAIVAENPQKFGIKRDKPLSELYKVLMGK